MNKALRNAMIEQIESRREAMQSKDLSEAHIEKVLTADGKLLTALKAWREPSEAPTALTKRIELRSYLSAYSRGKAVDGAEKELNTGLGLDTDTQIPWQALALEERADAPTNITQAQFGKTLNAILPRIFERTDAGFLGVTFPGVRAGTVAYPVMTGGTTAATKAANADTDAAAATFTVVTVNPTRITARYLWNLEGIAEMGQILESTLRTDLRNVMADQLDEQVINGNGTAPNVSGILQELTNPSNPSATATFPTYRNVPIDALDGKLTRAEGNIRVLLGLKTYQHARKLLNSTSERDAIEAMRGLGARVQYSVKLPDPSSNIQQAITTVEPGAAVAPVWQGITMIRDPYTNASKAQVALTAHMLFGFAFKRKDGWDQIAFKLA